MSHLYKILFAALVATGLMSAPALAQNAQQQAPTAPATAEQAVPEVSESDIQSFAEAYVGVQRLNQEYSTKLQALEDQTQAAQLQQEGQEKMRSAITDAGLTLAEYRQIAQAANQSPEIQQRLGAAIEAIVNEAES